MHVCVSIIARIKLAEQAEGSSSSASGAVQEETGVEAGVDSERASPYKVFHFFKVVTRLL